MEILIVDDERVIRDALSKLLQSEGYAVRTVTDGVSALAAIESKCPDLVLLDVMMPGTNGFAVCQKIRQLSSDVPVLFLTAKDSEVDQLRGFGVGADDYLAKTASEAILLARIAALLRRNHVSETRPTMCFSLGDAQVDCARLKLVFGEDTADLTLREIEMLRWFAANVGSVASHDFLLTRFWGVDSNVTLSALQMQIKRLREKLGPLGNRLASVHAQGYVFRAC